MPSFYHITITNPGNIVAPGDGFIDRTEMQYYIQQAGDNLETPPSDLTFALTTAKRRGNIRFLNMISELGLSGNFYIDEQSMVAPGGNFDSEPTSLTFTGMAEFSDSVQTLDELNEGQTLTGTAALVRMVARAIINSRTLETDIYDPTPTTTQGNTTLAARCGFRIETITVGPIVSDLATADGLVTATLVPTTWYP